MTYPPISPAKMRERINAAIRLPETITLDDGRTIGIQEWQPCATVDGLVTVSITGIVRLTDAQLSIIGR